MEITKLYLNENLFFVNIKKTHPFNFGDPPKKDYIKGSASGCWYVDIESLSKCNYVVAIYRDIVVGIFRIEDRIQANRSKECISRLLLNITYPPYRKYEILAHTYSNGYEIRKNLKENISIFEEVVKVDIDDPKRFNNWQKKRCFLILSECEDEQLNNLIGRSITKNNRPILYRKTTDYFIIKE